MASPIFSLPSELQDLIIACLGFFESKESQDDDEWENLPQKQTKLESQQDILNLSSTCTFYRSHLSPRIFQKITLRNDEKCIARVEASVGKKLSIRDYVSEFRFIGEVSSEHQRQQRNTEQMEGEEGETTVKGVKGDQDEETGTKMKAQVRELLDIVFPPVLYSLLSNLGSYFRNISTLSLELNFFLDDDYDEYVDDDFFDYLNFEENCHFIFEEEEESEEVLLEERNRVQRALLAEVYSAIAANNTNNERCRIKHLELTSVMPKEVSIWRTVDWRCFLGQLESFEISIVDFHHRTGRCINALDGYHAFIAKLSTFFFDHLHEATSLIIRPSKDGPLGLKGSMHSPLPLGHDSLPKLRHLTLENCFVSPELIDFLIAHGQTLESVRLEGCSASVSGLAKNGIHWHKLFDSVADLAPGKLRTFEVVPDQVDYNEFLNGKEEGLFEEDKLAEGMRRCFVYSSRDGTTGIIVGDDQGQRASFMKGEDRRAWKRLMGVVKANNRNLDSKN